MDLLFSAAYAPFTAALVGVLALALLEVLSLLLAGAGLSDLANLVLDTDAIPESAMTNWLLVNELPLSVVLMLGLFSFGASGHLVQYLSIVLHKGETLPVLLAVPLAVTGMLVGSYGLGKLVRPLFATTTTAVSAQSLIGVQATLLSPKALPGFAGEAKLLDKFGQVHYVMVEPDGESALKEGDQVVLLRQHGAGFVVRPLTGV